MRRSRYDAFLVGLLAKGTLGAVQLLCGIGLALTPAVAFPRLADWLARNELAENPTDSMALWVKQTFGALAGSEGTFYAVYLGLHGLLNLGLVLALLVRWPWAYPVSIIALAGFIVYQVHEYSVTGSVALIVLCVIDAAVIWLIWKEYRILRHS